MSAAAVSPFRARLVRAFGGDPDVFFPVARAHALLVKRRATVVLRGKHKASTSPFRALCLFALVYGILGVLFVMEAKSPLLGAALAVTVGCMFLGMIVVTDYLDLLVNPREQSTLGAHPHDDRSILLARLSIVGRTLALLFGLLFLPTTLVLLGAAGLAGAAAYVVGAAGASVTAVAAALFAGAAVLTLFGRAAFDRLMPWLQLAFQASYLAFFGGERLLRSMHLATISPAVAWAFPPLWFLAPFEAVRDHSFNASIAGRTTLAVVAFLGLTIGGVRWLGSRVGERLLEPTGRRRTASRRTSVRARQSRGLTRFFGAGESRQLFDLLRVHLRSDWRTRSEFLMGPLMCAVLFVTSFRSGGAWMGIALVGWFLIASADVLTRSPRPEILWFLLVSPMDRTRFSLGAVLLMRVFQLLPMAALFCFFELASAGPLWIDRALLLVELLAYGDLLIFMGRAFFPEFPFSRATRVDSATGSRRMVLFLAAGLLSGIATGGLFLASRLGRPGTLVAIGVLLAARFPIGAWMRRRVAAAAEGFEVEAGSVA